MQYTIWFQEQYRYCIEKLYCIQQNYFVQNDQRKNIFIYLIDYQKVFDNIGCELLMPIMQETSIDEKDIQIIHNCIGTKR